MKYGVAWLLGVPFSVIVLWFLANQIGCGFCWARRCRRPCRLWVGGDEKFVLFVSELGSPQLNCSNAVASLARAPTVLEELQRQL